MTQTEQRERPWPELTRERRAIVVADLVESVRLLAEHEDDVIGRWRRFVDEIRVEVLPGQGGRMVRSLGDGLLLEFDSMHGAIHTAQALHKRMQSYNADRHADAAMHLRVGVHEADIVVDEIDIFGKGVNLAARLATLAGPGEIILSPEARDALVPGLDVEIEDLGECYLRHLAQPQRAYRAGPVGQHSVLWAGGAAGVSDRVSIAVIPFPSVGEDRSGGLLGEVLADDLIAQLARLPQLHVVSRLSTTMFRERRFDLATLASTLACQYLVHGSCVATGERFRLRVEVVDAKTGAVVWADGLTGTVTDALVGASPVVEELTRQVCHALLDAEVRRAVTQPLPTLQSYTILLGAIALMHRLSPNDFARSHEMLAYLIERHPRATAPRAWLGKWHVLRVAQGWSPDPVTDSHLARNVVARALDLDPHHGLALAIDGLICAYINKDLATAAARYDAAVLANPSEGLAWLFMSALHSYRNEGEVAVECALRAQRLSPLDPMKYYYDNFTSTAMLSARDFAGAIEYGRRSLRANRTHGSTLRILAIAQALDGRLDEARSSVAELLRVEPGFSVARFLERYPGAGCAQALEYAEALSAAGLPP